MMIRKLKATELFSFACDWVVKTFLGFSNMALEGDPANYVNDSELEHLWVTKAIEDAEVYINLLQSVDTKYLKLSYIDDRLYEAFSETFPELQVEKLSEDDLKNEDAKVKWRKFCEQFKPLIENFNFGTLLRLDSNGGYSERNSTFSYKLQFLAIEIARNRRNCNKSVFHLSLWLSCFFRSSCFCFSVNLLFRM